MKPQDTASLKALFEAIPELELAVLIGSRARKEATADSDWDIALQWHRRDSFSEQLAATENLRRQLSHHLKVPEASIDLIDLPRAGLTMRAVVAEEGIVLNAQDSLIWKRFLQRVWRELEEYYWDEIYAN
ncbi:type VII toxin-antitoxin system MntA family adenylyltransferase antitoxin [Geoalkalibacter halelectricus]|uniref:Nucleotidyltransferase domain-containing protein n=1 Tax=Geoalkalibacter halelectricus TaxID=2847045 RepID=A0ABY5ZKS0_9BACT|nr:nucleotidyltransferase domain-containing protein [Geoalkalibacter halelectricus]MDO3377837.1 nucleotidyltransferase domain-containing protein [Geoalkalibacter halelectricus]UWZ79723.1 nucleotidyltransferase domain-containing protein [Geoalkalibacter halelectricus]